MGRQTPSQTKNAIRRSLYECLDPQPPHPDKRRVWTHFNSGCAYCGTSIPLGDKKSHLDHLIPSSSGGKNHISNRVPSCADCNEKEKLDSHWEEFLRRKCEHPEEFLARLHTIRAWQSQFSRDDTTFPADVVSYVAGCADEAISAYSLQVEKVRQFASYRRAGT
jgi:hypothetical protein